MKRFLFSIAATSILFATAPLLNAQTKPSENKVNLVFGLNQLLARGFNVETNVFYKRLAFDYSHGISLDFTGNALTGAEKEQKLAVHLPWTTGFGVGYRFSNAFNVRLEPKWHRFEIYYDGDVQNANTRLGAYTTFTLGVGAYYNWQPFQKKENALKGIMIVPSVRFWPKVSSTLAGDKFTYQNTKTEKQETHEAMEVGFGNTPLVLNISIGYSFNWK